VAAAVLDVCVQYDAASTASAAGQHGYYAAPGAAHNAPSYYQQPVQQAGPDATAAAAAAVTKPSRKGKGAAASSLQAAAVPMTPAGCSAAAGALVPSHAPALQMPPPQQMQNQQHLNGWLPHMLSYYHPSQAAAPAMPVAVQHPAAAAQSLHPSMLPHDGTSSQAPYAAGPALPPAGQLQLLATPAVGAAHDSHAAALQGTGDDASQMECEEATADSEQPQLQSARRPAAKSKAAAAGASTAAGKGKPKAAAGKRGRPTAADAVEAADDNVEEEEESELVSCLSNACRSWCVHVQHHRLSISGC
jgi:hypothetical protein